MFGSLYKNICATTKKLNKNLLARVEYIFGVQFDGAIERHHGLLFLVEITKADGLHKKIPRLFLT